MSQVPLTDAFITKLTAGRLNVGLVGIGLTGLVGGDHAETAPASEVLASSTDGYG